MDDLLEQLRPLISFEGLLLFFLVVAVFITRARYHRALHSLDQLNRQKLYRGFRSLRLLQVMSILSILVPMILLSQKPPEDPDLTLLLLSLLAILAVLWLGPGYSYLRSRMEALGLPPDFVKAYFSDRWALAAVLAVLLVISYLQLLQQ